MNYPYAIGTIKAIEDKLLDKTKLSKLFKLSKNEFLKTLKDMGYGDNEVKNFDLEQLIKSEIDKTRKYLAEIAPEKNYIDLFYLSNDALNIRTLWKMKIFNTDHKYLLVDNGSINVTDLYNMVFNNVYNSIDKKIVGLLKSIEEEVKDLNDPRSISVVIDKLVYDYAFNSLGLFPSNALKTYFQALIDFANISVLVRSLKLNWDIERFTSMLISNGKINKEIFIEAYNLNSDNIVNNFKDYYNNKVYKILNEYFNNFNLTILEHKLSSLLIEVMKEFKYDSFTIGPIVYYYLIKEAEAKNIRIIYSNPNIELNDLLDY